MNSAYAACHDHGSAQRRLLRGTDCVNLNVRRNDCATTALLKLAKQQITRESESNGIEWNRMCTEYFLANDFQSILLLLASAVTSALLSQRAFRFSAHRFV